MSKLSKDIKTILLDLDGTVYLSNVLINGALESINKLRENYNVIFLTNNTSRSKKDYALKLEKLGIKSKEEDFFTASDATIYYLKKNFNNKKIHLFGTKSLKNEFIKNDICLDNENPDLCVVGFHTDFHYDELALLTSFIRKGVPFIATHPDINCPTLDGFIPDVGSFLALIEKSTNKTPHVVCGKPEKSMAEGILKYT